MEENSNTSGIGAGVAAIVVGSGILLAIWMLVPVPLWDLLSFALLVLLPIFAALFAFGLIGGGTMKLIFNGGLVNKVRAEVDRMSAENFE